MSVDRDAAKLAAQLATSPQVIADGIRREPWCWLEKKKLRILSDVFGEGRHGSLAAARSVMLALSEIASDRQSETFTASTSYIAQRAGVTSKTVRRMVKTFKKLGFVSVQSRSANGLKIASEYTLIRGKSPLRLSYPSMGKRPKIRLPRREESDEESTEGTARTGEKIFVSPDEKKGQSAEDDEEDMVIHPRTGERFNKRTGEFDW
jgi:hypothetical protein